MVYVDIHMDGNREPFKIKTSREEAEHIENEMAKKGVIEIINPYNHVLNGKVIINFDYVKYIEIYEVPTNV